MNFTPSDLVEISKVEFDPKGGSIYLLQDLKELELEGESYEIRLSDEIKKIVGITTREYMNILSRYQNRMYHQSHLLMVWHLLEFYQLDKYDLGSLEEAKKRHNGVNKLFKSWYFDRGVFIKIPPKFSLDNFKTMIHVESLKSRQLYCINNQAA